MSYSRQLPIYLGANWSLDYSDGGLSSNINTPNIGLTETALREANGNLRHTANPARPTDPTPWIVWGTPTEAQTFKKIQTRTSTATSNIDWSGNGVITPATPLPGTIPKDVNNFGIFGCAASGPTSTAYNNYNEWANLDYNFRQGPSGQFDAVYPVLISEENTVIVIQQTIGSAEEKSVAPWNKNSTIKKT